MQVNNKVDNINALTGLVFEYANENHIVSLSH
jgi:hypothetical protein